jgi:hypothetical protein
VLCIAIDNNPVFGTYLVDPGTQVRQYSNVATSKLVHRRATKQDSSIFDSAAYVNEASYAPPVRSPPTAGAAFYDVSLSVCDAAQCITVFRRCCPQVGGTIPAALSTGVPAAPLRAAFGGNWTIPAGKRTVLCRSIRVGFHPLQAAIRQGSGPACADTGDGIGTAVGYRTSIGFPPAQCERSVLVSAAACEVSF